MRQILIPLAILFSVNFLGGPPIATATSEETLEKVRYPWNPNDYQVGYYLGEIIHSETVGFPIRSLEVHLLLGNNSSSGTKTDASCMVYFNDQLAKAETDAERVEITNESQEKCTLYDNPVQVSSMNKSMAFHAKVTKSGLTMVYYKRFFVNLFTDTHYIVKNVYDTGEMPVSGNTSMDIHSHYPIDEVAHYGKGEIHGRVVHAYLNGKIRPVYTIIVQEGDSGNTFYRLNVAKKDLFDFIVDLMRTGELLKISYLEVFGVEQFFEHIWPGYETRMRVTEVGLLGNAVPTQ